MFPNPISSPVAAPQGKIFVRYTQLVMYPAFLCLSSSARLLNRNHPQRLLSTPSAATGGGGGNSPATPFALKTPTGRSCGKTKSTAEDRENWTTMCRHVVKSGKWKFRCSGENIHLLYCTDVSAADFSRGCSSTHDRYRERKGVPRSRLLKGDALGDPRGRAIPESNEHQVHC